MNYRIHRFELLFKRPFVLAHGTRTGTDALFFELIDQEKSFWGEAVFPPYLKANYLDTCREIERFMESCESLEMIRALLTEVSLSPCALSAIEGAVIQWEIARQGVGWTEHFETNPKEVPLTLTFSKSDTEILEEKKVLAQNFSHVKLKWTGEADDVDFTNFIYQKIGLPIAIDANQGYPSKKAFLDQFKKIEHLPIALVEQPFNKEDIESHFQLFRSISVPLYADESIQNLQDFQNFGAAFHGVNVKLLKCGGLTKGKTLIDQVKMARKEVLIGCMAESSLGMSLASILAPLCNYADLDAPYLIKNDPFQGTEISERKLHFKEIKKVLE